MIKSTLSNKSENPESLKKYSQQFESSSTNVHKLGENLPRWFYKLLYLRFFLFKWSMKKHYAAKVLFAIWQIFLHGNNRNCNSYQFSYKFDIIHFLFFLRNQKQESTFQQVGGLATINISVLYLYRVALYFKAMPNSIGFYKGIFLHVIPVRIIVPWF